MCFRCTKTFWPGDAPGPPNDIRAPCQPARRCPGLAACREEGAERRGRITGQIAHTGHPATASHWAIEVAPTLFPWLDRPPRGCRVPLPEVRNRGYSYPSGGRVRALHAILRPRIPRDLPPNGQNRREGGLPGSTRLRGCGATRSSARDSPARILTASPVATEFSAGRSGRGSRRPDLRPRRGSARPRPRRRGSAGGAPRRPPLLRRAGKPWGQRGHGPPPASAGDARSVAPRSKLACLP